MTPHHGEMAHLTGKDAETVAADPATAAEQVAQDFGAVVALKSERTVVAGPDLPTVVFEGGNIGLATSGSGDVLAGIVGGLASRGTDPFTATGWAVHVHGAAGDAAAAEFATIGYLARDLLRFIPGLLASSTLSA